MASLDSNRGAKRAREARTAAGLDPLAPIDVLDAIEAAFGVPVVIGAWPDEIAGACTGHGAQRVFFVNGRHAKARQRFTLAHELGHVRCGHDGTVAVETVLTLNGTTTNRYEVQANAFAGELLVPREAVRRRFDREPALEEVVLLAAEYGVSAQAALIRVRTAGVVSDRVADRVQHAVERGEHVALSERLGLAPLDDRLARLDALPYLSPALAGSALAAVVDGSATATAAAGAAGVDVRRLGAAVRSFSAG